MRRIYKKIYGIAANTLLHPFCKLFVDAVVVAAAGYLSIKKLTGFSISGWLLNNAFHQPMVDGLVVCSVFFLVVAIALKLTSLAIEYFPPTGQSSVDPDEISDCLMRINQEIQTHLDKFDPRDLTGLKALNEQHAFDINTRAIVEALAEHMRRSINNVSLRRRDMFISLYALEQCGRKLRYLLHYDPKRDIVKSKVINLDDQEHSRYECAKCLNSDNSTAFISQKNDYVKGDPKRYKTIRQYMGCKLCVAENVYGFLNIEFHKHDVFTDEDEMEDFMLEHVMPFKMLLEYQFLKRRFFEGLAKLDVEGR